MRLAIAGADSRMSSPYGDVLGSILGNYGPRENRCIAPWAEQSSNAARRDALIAELANGKVELESFYRQLVPDNIPKGFNLQQFRESAKSMGPIEVYESFKTGGQFDFKRGGRSEYADFGNWAAGFFAKESPWLTLEMFRRAAGFYQEFFQSREYVQQYGHSYEFWTELTGDDPWDTALINTGYLSAAGPDFLLSPEQFPAFDDDFWDRAEAPEDDWQSDEPVQDPSCHSESSL